MAQTQQRQQPQQPVEEHPAVALEKVQAQVDDLERRVSELERDLDSSKKR